MGVGVLGGLIYAVGGYDGNSRQCLSSVEVQIWPFYRWGGGGDDSRQVLP